MRLRPVRFRSSPLTLRSRLRTWTWPESPKLGELVRVQPEARTLEGEVCVAQTPVPKTGQARERPGSTPTPSAIRTTWKIDLAVARAPFATRMNPSRDRGSTPPSSATVLARSSVQPFRFRAPRRRSPTRKSLGSIPSAPTQPERRRWPALPSEGNTPRGFDTRAHESFLACPSEQSPHAPVKASAERLVADGVRVPQSVLRSLGHAHFFFAPHRSSPTRKERSQVRLLPGPPMAP